MGEDARAIPTFEAAFKGRPGRLPRRGVVMSGVREKW
jgi:hypothetical protein